MFFHLGKLLLALDTFIAIPVILNLDSGNSPLLFAAYQVISFLNLPNSATSFFF